jgi:hypothetical protein
MAETTQPQIRQRVNVSQTAKGLSQVEVTYERVSETGIHPDQIAEETLQLIKAVESKLRDSGRKMAVDENG